MNGEVPLPSIVGLLETLVRVPSRTGEDDTDAVCIALERWLAERRMPFRSLRGAAGERLGLYLEVRGERGAGPWTVLDATLDTAGDGDPSTWRLPPSAARIEDGWLHGRGSADSKGAVALFSHLLLELAARPDFAGRVGALFDLDEHTGRFGGARAFFDEPEPGGDGPPRPDGVYIGYPGLDRVISGCRGFLRATLVVHGVAAHAGSSRQRGVNAISRAASLVGRLESMPLPGPSGDFPLGAQLTVTALHGGGRSFTQVPDRCEALVDIRVTPAWPLEAARQAVEALVRAFDAGSAGALEPTRIDWQPGWPAYQLAATQPLVAALRGAAHEVLGAEVPAAVVGPSNIGNYLASLGVPAVCGFGLRAEGVHAANERVALDSIEPVYRIYRGALALLHRP